MIDTLICVFKFPGECSFFLHDLLCAVTLVYVAIDEMLLKYCCTLGNTRIHILYPLIQQNSISIHG